MRRAAFLALVVTGVSCHTIVRIEFRGRDVADSSGLIQVRGEKALGRIVVTSPKFGLVLPLPYGEDWEVKAGADDEGIGLNAISRRDVGLAIWLRPREGVPDVPDETYLRDRLLPKERARAKEWWGDRIEDASVSAQELGPVLQYVMILVPRHANDKEERHFHVWTVRRTGQTSCFYELWLWSFHAPGPDSAALHEQLGEIAGKGFRVEAPKAELKR